MIKNSGHRTEFATGARRDIQHGKGRMDLLPWYGIMEVSKHCEEGAEKYGEHNVDKGIPLHSLCDSAARHLAKFIAGETDEDHLRAAAWNLLWALNQRKTHPELDDLYSHKEKVEKVRTALEMIKNAKENGELVFIDTESTVDETCGEALCPLTRDEILQRCREAQDVYVVSKFEMLWSGWCYLQFAIPDNEGDPLSVFMYPLKGEGHKPFLYTPEKFEVYDTDPSESLKETKDNDIKPKEPTVIEPLTEDELRDMEELSVYVVSKHVGVPSDWWKVHLDDGNRIILENRTDHRREFYDSKWMEAYMIDPKDALKQNEVELKEPTVIEPLSKELLLGMNGRFVYLVQRFENSDESCNFVSREWVRIKVDDNDIFIVAEDEHNEDISQQKWNPSWMNCYITDPENYKR